MAIDTPARLVILGAGPIGLEAALYARFLGYDVEIFEQGRLAENLRRTPHLQLPGPFADYSSPLGLAALAAQDENFHPPAPHDRLTTGQWIERYLEPLASTDLLADQLRLHTAVIAVGRSGFLKGECADDEVRGDYPLRLLTSDAQGQEQIVEADGVIDATGTYGTPNFLGEGGIPARGERAARLRRDNPLISYLPDLLGTARATYLDRHTVVVGDGELAQQAVAWLASLASESGATRVTWVRRALPETDVEPTASVTVYGGTAVQALAPHIASGGWELELVGQHAGPLVGDRLLALVGYRPDTCLFEELHVPVDLAGRQIGTSGPLLTTDAFHATGATPAGGVLPEPHYHVIGAKSGGRLSPLGYRQGLDQIRRLFALLGDRPSLDLYAGAVRLPR